MSSTKSIGYSTLLLVLMLIQATLQTPVNALDFEGDYKFLTVSPSVCATYSCSYQCGLAFKITVSGATATLYPTTNPSGCVCETLFATIIGDTATGMGFASVYSLKRTSTGLEIVAQVSSLVCVATYTTTSSSSTSTTNSAAPTSTASSSTTSPVTNPTGSITGTTPASTTDSITGTMPASATDSSIASTASPTSGTTITRSGAAQSSGYTWTLGWVLTASSALALCCL